MAINFLNSVDFNKNELLNPTIENQPNDAGAGTGVEGQLYFNTTDDILKVYAGGSWVEVGGGVTSLTTTDGTYIDLTPNSATTGAVTVTADLSAVDGTAGAGERYLTKSNTWATVASIPGTYTFTTESNTGSATVDSGDNLIISGGTYITGAVSKIGTDITNRLDHDSTSRTDTTSTDNPAFGGTFEAVQSVTTNATGHVTAIDVSTVTLQTPEFFVDADSGTPQTIEQSDTLTISGGTNINTVVGVTDTVTVNLDDSVTLAGTLTVNGAGQSSFAGQVTIPTTPVASTDAASKAYVDDAVAGGLVYQGGYNAATNTPDLTTSPNSILKGWTYTVTADGTFFGEQLRIGDVLIAEQDNPSALANWTTVQNNVDLASLTQVGIGNVNEATASSLLGIDVAYSSGTASVGLDIKGLTDGSGSVDPGGASLAVFNQPDNTNYKIKINDIAPFISAANTYAATISATGTITHNLDTRDVIIQLYDTVTYETVYADVDRISTTQATITFATTPTNSIRVLVQKIG
jgi:hypothetical protein